MDQKLHKLRMTPIEHGVVTDVQLVEAGAPASFPGPPIGPAPEHIKVCVTCRPEEESNIRIEVWLPTEGWNGDLVGVGNGGAAGHILPFVMVGPLRLGFAVTTTDMGTSAGSDFRFTDSEKKIIKSMKFPDNFNEKVSASWL